MAPNEGNRIIEINLPEIILSDELRLSYPIRKERLDYFNIYYPTLPLIFINEAHQIIFGWDHYQGLKENNKDQPQKIKVLVCPLSIKESLFLGFNLCTKHIKNTIYRIIYYQHPNNP